MSMPSLPRSSGVLLHPTSLPGPFGVGDLGISAYRWVETLAHMRQSWWQVLPLTPPGAGDSPYQSYSAFAGNVNLLSPEQLQQDGLVDEQFWGGAHFPADRVDYPRVTAFKSKLLRAAWDAFGAGRGAHLRADFERYCAEESSWLDGYALFTAIRESLGGAGLLDWPPELRRREPAALARIEKTVSGEVQLHKFGQFLFDRQWGALKKFAAERGVKIIGDAPIFVSLDSADVWANPEAFLLDGEGRPTVVAGVPPDYFAEDGQLWGNPIYNWPQMASNGYAWWCARLKRQLQQVHYLRLDHFRGFAQAWHVPAGEATARNGKWVDGPGLRLFERLRESLCGLPLVAEDLGLITDDVHELREALKLPGMRVLQFALAGPDSPHWPHNFERNTVGYTGTHDNDTVNGWFAALSERDRNYLALTLGKGTGDPAWNLIQAAWASVAVLAVAPLQDLLSLGGEARMNKPGVAEGNWRWRFRGEQFRQDIIGRLADLTTLYNRAPKEENPK